MISISNLVFEPDLNPKNNYINQSPALNQGENFKKFQNQIQNSLKQKAINLSGKEGFDNMIFDKNGLARVKINERYGFVDMNNELIIQPVHEYVSNFYDGLASVKVNGKERFLNTYGNFISNKEYEETRIFWEGRSEVKINGKWGLIDKDENILVPFLSYLTS